MFYIRNEAFDPKYPKFRVLKFQKELGLKYYGLHNSLPEVINKTFSYGQYQHHFLLDDERFHFFSFDIFKTTEGAFTMEMLNEVIDERLKYLKQITHEELLFTYIDSIFVNDLPKKFVIGEKGQIFFKLYLIYINRNTLLSFNKVYGNIFNQENVHILPESFKTIFFLKKRLQRDSFILLYIKDTYCKAIVIENGFYKKIEPLNFGISALMQMYKDSEIVKYRYKTTEEIEANPFAKNLIIQSIQFYVDYLCKWLSDHGMTDKDLFIISPIIKNANFMELFNKLYSSYHDKYIVPFHSSDELDSFGKKRDPEDMDILVFLNGSVLKKTLKGN